MRILHTGDIHLDSAYCAYGAKDAEQQRESGRQLLRRIFECAKSENCQMILISGDLFDSRIVTPDTAELFCGLVEDCGIPVVISPGNHDAYTDNSFYKKVCNRLEDKLFVFTSPELQVFDFDSLGVRVFGYAFTSSALTKSPLAVSDIPQDNGYIRILCAHADISSPLSRYAPVTLEEIERFGFAYSALGHIHNRWATPELDGRARYCGFGEGRSFDELGEGGVWIVDTDGETTSCERKILSRKAFYTLNLEITEQDVLQTVKEKIRTEIEKIASSASVYVRLILNGNADERLVKDILASLEDIRVDCKLEYIEITDRTMPLLDGDYLEKDATLRGELYRILRPQMLSSNTEERARAIRALRIGLAAIEGRSIFGADEKGGKL